MELYTFIMEFRGGTYISQVRAEHLYDSLKLWGKQLKPKDIQHLGEKGKNELLAELNDEELTKVSTMKNVWYFGLSIKKGYIAVNVIKTSKTEELNPLRMEEN
jgi:hypothetical protein